MGRVSNGVVIINAGKQYPIVQYNAMIQFSYPITEPEIL